jgi:hypothetical protein
MAWAQTEAHAVKGINTAVASSPPLSLLYVNSELALGGRR